jgi:hypothetical protein
MQIIEESMAGLRSAVLRLTRHDTPLRFELYPMLHVAEPAFYAAVTERLKRCDLVVAEGVGRPEPGRPAGPPPASASLLTLSYRLPAWFERSGLVLQNIDYKRLGVPVRFPDMTAEQFQAGWRKLPLWQRAVTSAASPLVGLDQLLFGSRRALARQVAMTDLDWYDEATEYGSLEELMDLIGDQRERLLIAELDEIHRTRCHEPITVAVVYGAGHVPPIIDGMRGLHRYGVRSAEWLTLWSY